ncbi:MAG: prolipoprotein diacylglyceryl transferase [Acetobacter sp.]|nr:prolipoprotein diacylglyceryl transferase [Acetobacter sp.]
MLPFIEVFGIRIAMYGVCVFTGIILSGMLIHLNTKKRRDFSYIQIINIPLFSAAGAFVGAKLLYFVTRLDIFFSSKAWENFWYSITEACGGMVFYGGLVGGILTSYIYCIQAFNLRGFFLFTFLFIRVFFSMGWYKIIVWEYSKFTMSIK